MKEEKTKTEKTEMPEPETAENLACGKRLMAYAKALNGMEGGRTEKHGKEENIFTTGGGQGKEA